MALPKYSVLQVRPAKDSLTGQAAFVEFLYHDIHSFLSSY